MIPPALFFILKIVLAIWDLLCYHRNFKIFIPICENAIGILIEIGPDLSISLGSIVILAVLILPIHGVFLHFLCSF